MRKQTTLPDDKINRQMNKQTFHEMTVAPYWKMSQVVALLRPWTNLRVLIELILDFEWSSEFPKIN